MSAATKRNAARAAIAVMAFGLTGVGVPANAAPSTSGASVPPVDRGTDYVAIGDSYASGFGALSYLPGAANRACGRSSLSYPVELAGHKGLDLHFEACQGATTAMVLGGQLRPLSTSTDLVTIQVGGNDSGISPAVSSCMAPFNRPACVAAMKSVEAFSRTALPTLLDGVYSRVRRKAPNAQVVVVGYSRIFEEKAEKFCQAGIFLDKAERVAINDATETLNTTVQAAAARHGFDYVDPMATFEGHAACTATPWMLGLVTANPMRSFHPNSDGNDAYVRLLAGAVH